MVAFMSSFKESLYQKKGYIYQIGNDFYAIGANIFTKVTDSPEVDNVELLNNAIKKNNERQISKYFDKIIRLANAYRVDAKEHYRLQEKLFAFIDELEKNDNESYIELQKQVCFFDELVEKYGNE